MNGNIKSFTDLIVWRKAHVFVLKIYSITESFPKEEKYALSNQLRRAVVSVTSNIAEGFARRTAINKNQFYYNSLASLAEIQNQLIIAHDLKYIQDITFKGLNQDLIEIQKMMNGLIKSSVTKQHT